MQVVCNGSNYLNGAKVGWFMVSFLGKGQKLFFDEFLNPKTSIDKP